MRVNVTKRTVDSADPGARDYFLWDDKLTGWGLKVTPNGRKVYVLKTRVGGRLKRFTIGAHGSPWTPDTARAAALGLLGEIATGRDPTAKHPSHGEITISELCEIYLREGCAAKKASTLAVDKGRIAGHILPLLGTRTLASLDRGDVERFMIDVAAGRTAANRKTKARGRSIVRGGKGAATRTVGLLGAILEFALKRGLAQSNPARGIQRYPDTRIERYLTKEELARLRDALMLAQQSGVNQFALEAIRLLLMTGCRKSEIQKLRWEWVDFERACLRLPDSKTGRKVVPLGTAALEILERIPRVRGNPHVIPGEVPASHFVGLQKVWERVRVGGGLPQLRLHDLRHHFISVGAAGGESLYLLGKVAGHRQPTTTQRYAHLGEDPVRQVAERVSRSIAESLR